MQRALDDQFETIKGEMIAERRVSEIKDRLRSGRLEESDHQDLLRLVEQTESSIRLLRAAMPDGW